MPVIRRAGDSQVGDGGPRDRAAVEACLNCWMDVRWNLVRASADIIGDLRGAIIVVWSGVLCEDRFRIGREGGVNASLALKGSRRFRMFRDEKRCSSRVGE